MVTSDTQIHHAKRRKIAFDEHPAPTAQSGTRITSHTQLRDLLILQPNTPSDTKHGVNTFKDFLIFISQLEKENEKAKKFRILKAYCDSQIKTVGDGSEAACFPDLIQTWSFADSNNNESLLVVVPSVLALFLKTISTQLEFRDFGIALCKYLLQKEQLRLFNRNLTSTKSKEHLISPCIRLLTEIVSFDGGAVARLVYSRREITLKRLDIFLTPNKAQIEAALDESKKSTLRHNAQRYVLANLRFLNSSSKKDFVEQHKTMRSFLEHIRRDSRDLVSDTIKAIHSDIANDSALPRSTKSKFFNKWNLERLVTLYGYDRDSDEPESQTLPIAKEIHELLTQICTVSELGVLLPQTGWYPVGNDPDTWLNAPDDNEAIDLGLDSPLYQDKYWDRVPVRNGTLSALIQVLRPESDTLQIDLLLSIFKVAPELVADFFTKRTMFTADPKPTQSWLGESAFLFSTVQLPVPVHCGWKYRFPAMPPPVSVVTENVLPRPLTQNILTRCLNQNADVVTLFAVRMLTVTFRKLDAVLEVFKSEHGFSQDLWDQAASKLVTEFCQRCPSMKDVILTFKRTSKEDLQQQDAVMELLSLFYEVVPSVAFEENFDVTLILVDILHQLDKPELPSETSALLFSLLQNTLKIARCSLNMRWWQKPASLQYSAFTSILKVFIEASDKTPLKQIRPLFWSVLTEEFILRNSDASFNALLSSLEASSSESLPAQLEFLDNCLCRVVKKPVQYLDLANGLLHGTKGPLSYLVAAVNEQWPFITKANDVAKERSVASWIAQFLGEMKQAGEDGKALKAVRDSLMEATQSKETRSIFKKALQNVPEPTSQDVEMVDADLADTTKSQIEKSGDLLEIFGSLPTENKNHTALHRWENDDIEIAIEQGRIGDLMLCLCSEHEEIRRETFAAISRFMAKIKNSNYAEWRSIYTLAGELRQTVNQLGFETPLPRIAGECAASCVVVLSDPLHKLYGKVNKFLQKYPFWEVGKLPSYWIDKILLHPPEYDDAVNDEMSWLLDLLVRGVRTMQDVEIYRRANVFEHILTLYCSPLLNASMKKKILHMVYRVAQAGGSTTLITRAAAISWIDIHVSWSDVHTFLLSELARAIYDTCDKERVDRWSTGSISRDVEEVARKAKLGGHGKRWW